MGASKPVRIQQDTLDRLETLAYRITLKEKKIVDRTETTRRVIEEGLKQLEKKYPEKK
jgi:hypothetical protein